MPLPAGVSEEAKFWMEGAWVKREYFIQGSLIRPVAGSEPQPYDPFDGYQHDDSPRKQAPIYLEVMALDLEDDRKIRDFCCDWGLLGIFQDRLVQAHHVWGRDSVRGWDVEAPDLWWQFFDPRYWDAGSPEAADRKAWVLAEIEDGIYDQVPLRKYYSRFFPDIRWEHERTAEYTPRLYGRELWDQLCEPLEDFRANVDALRQAIAAATATRGGTPSWGDISAGNILKRIRRVHQGLRWVPPNSPERTWVFPSLLSALWSMFLQDLTGGRLRECANPRCRKPFVGSRVDQRFCSKKCLDRVAQWNRRHPYQTIGGKP